MVEPVIEYPGDITCIDTEQVRPGMACCYLLRGGGERYALVECGTSLSAPAVLAVLERKGVAREQVAYVVPTHVHLDHAGGAGMLMRHLPRARLLVHPRGARHLVDPARLIEGTIGVYGPARTAAMYGEIVPVPEARVTAVADGFALDFDGRLLRFIDAPGHARHHFVVWDARTRGLFSGDTFGISYRDTDGAQGPFVIPTTTPVQFDPQAWLATVERLLALRPECAYLTHYGRVAPVQRLAADLKRGIEAYVRLAQQHADAPRRTQALVEALTGFSLREMRALHCPMPEAQARDFLEMDMRLNAQGLEVWLEQGRAGRSGARPNAG
ncbi:MAG: MBL fold metallo-hydrolase [Nevskia sp.]|nr:MBL fold metallo-hydrolase [Nevskia sp.]